MKFPKILIDDRSTPKKEQEQTFLDVGVQKYTQKIILEWIGCQSSRIGQTRQRALKPSVGLPEQVAEGQR